MVREGSVDRQHPYKLIGQTTENMEISILAGLHLVLDWCVGFKLGDIRLTEY